LGRFAKSNNALSMLENAWDKIPGYKALKSTGSFDQFEYAFKFVCDASINTKGKILFNLDGVNLEVVANIKPGTGLFEKLPQYGGESLWEKGYITEWEASSLLNDKKYLQSVEFHMEGKPVPTQKVQKKLKTTN